MESLVLRVLPCSFASFSWLISEQERALHGGRFPQSECSSEQGRAVRARETRSPGPSSALPAKRESGHGEQASADLRLGWVRPLLAMGRGAKDCLPCPTACPEVQSVCIRFTCKTHLTSFSAPTRHWTPFQPPLASPWLGFLKSKTISLSQLYLPVGVPSAAPQCRALT